MKVEFKDNSSEVLSAMKEQLKIGLDACGAEAEGYAKDNCPVDTGRLRNSITHEVDDNTVYIGTNVEYAPYVEFNDKASHTSGGAHFLRDAATTHGDHYKEILEMALKA